MGFLQTGMDVFATCRKFLLLSGSQWQITAKDRPMSIFVGLRAACRETLLSPSYLFLCLWWRPSTQCLHLAEALCVCPSSLQPISDRFDLVIMVNKTLFFSWRTYETLHKPFKAQENRNSVYSKKQMEKVWPVSGDLTSERGQQLPQHWLAKLIKLVFHLSDFFPCK